MKSLYALPLLLAAGAALADDAALLRCRALNDTGERLACYDAIELAPGRVVYPAAVAAPAPAAVPTPTPEQSFGMATVKRAEPEEPKFIETAISGVFQGWGPNTRFKLANGQVWRVVDGSEAVLAPVQDPKVRIVRNLFGTMFLEIPGTNNSPKVRRVR
ncbi:hypothetical protein [Massilia sp. 9096]|uniref:hypothetical protein n=1 Tax=Massilia sp. 9096 TaxID=1500894 RepID=UPI0005614729|nr:hypothetical protein [Massilia sp. 9096]